MLTETLAVDFVASGTSRPRRYAPPSGAAQGKRLESAPSLVTECPGLGRGSPTDI